MNVVYYINQFFGQIGGESEAGYPLRVRNGPVGPGILFKTILKDEVNIVATIICGDNYFNENNEVVSKKIKDILQDSKAELLIAHARLLTN